MFKVCCLNLLNSEPTEYPTRQLWLGMTVVSSPLIKRANSSGTFERSFFCIMNFYEETYSHSVV